MPATRYIRTTSTQPIGASASFEPELSMPATAMRPPKTPSTISAPTAVNTGNQASVRSLRSTRHDNLPRYHERWILPTGITFLRRATWGLAMLARAEDSSSSTASRAWRAPGRVNLIGDHTDYQDGFCLPMAIDRECRITVTPGTTAGIRAQSAQLDGAAEVALDGSTDPETIEPRWARFVAGAARVVHELGSARLPAVDLEITSTVPVG